MLFTELAFISQCQKLYIFVPTFALFISVHFQLSFNWMKITALIRTDVASPSLTN